MDQQDKPSLEIAIRDEARRVIADIARKETEEIKRLDAEYAAELEEFQQKMKAQTDAKIGQESSRIENRARLDLKKRKLKSVEAYVSRTVEEVAKGIRDNPHYKQFLLDVIRDAVSRIPAGAEVRLAGDDLVFEKEIREAVKSVGGSRDIAIVEDRTIKWGGCIVIDASGGRIFDSTLERIYFRKSAAIRREVMSLLAHPSENAG
jgi:vacuolar-type H+-ATPase subunit E/Vma4